MNKLVKRGFSAYKIFLKDKLAMSLMMFIPGMMMFIGAINGKGNDTVAMPLGILSAGLAFTFWSFYQIGYIRANFVKMAPGDAKSIEKTAFYMQIFETVLYLAVVALGVFLLINQAFMNKVLNLMSGGFTTLNGVLGAIEIYKKREHKDFRWWFKLVLTVVELVLGPYFLFMSDGVEIGWYVAMGALTAMAGALEVISALTPESIRSTMQDGKDIVQIFKERG